jgi:hypothetical protein
MTPSTPSVTHNPLTAFMRQPKIFIRLPSEGKFWTAGSLIQSETGEYPVYSMTAHDELTLKIPDALMNGQAVVDVIQNCVPNIKNAWEVPSIDMDVILIAIRIATYGEKLTTPITIGEDELEYTVDLRSVMDSLMQNISWEEHIAANDDLTIYVKPINYKQMTQMSVQTFETQKIMQIVNNESLSEEDKIAAFKDSFTKLTNVTIGMVTASIYKIDTPQGSTDSAVFIKEFMDNVDKEIFNSVQNHLELLKEQNSVKPIIIPVTDELREKGFTGDTIEVPLTFDAASFFG